MNIKYLLNTAWSITLLVIIPKIGKIESLFQTNYVFSERHFIYLLAGTIIYISLGAYAALPFISYKFNLNKHIFSFVFLPMLLIVIYLDAIKIFHLWMPLWLNDLYAFTIYSFICGFSLIYSLFSKYSTSK